MGIVIVSTALSARQFGLFQVFFPSSQLSEIHEHLSWPLFKKCLLKPCCQIFCISALFSSLPVVDRFYEPARPSQPVSRLFLFWTPIVLDSALALASDWSPRQDPVRLDRVPCSASLDHWYQSSPHPGTVSDAFVTACSGSDTELPDHPFTIKPFEQPLYDCRAFEKKEEKKQCKHCH